MWISRAIKLLLICLKIILQIRITYEYVYDSCELANELVQVHEFQSEEIDKWICLVYAESSFMTDAVGPLSKKDKSKDFGLFQINSFYWCNSSDTKLSSEFNICNEECENYLDDDLSDDLRCVRLIFSIHGFKAWRGYYENCFYSKEIFNDNCDQVPTINSTLIQYIHKTRPYEELPKLPDYSEKRDHSNFIIKSEFQKKKILKIDEMNDLHENDDDSITIIATTTSKSTTIRSTSTQVLKKQFNSNPLILKNNLLSNFRNGNRLKTTKMDLIMKESSNNEYRATISSMANSENNNLNKLKGLEHFTSKIAAAINTLKFNLIRNVPATSAPIS